MLEAEKARNHSLLLAQSVVLLLAQLPLHPMFSVQLVVLAARLHLVLLILRRPLEFLLQLLNRAVHLVLHLVVHLLRLERRQVQLVLEVLLVQLPRPLPPTLVCLVPILLMLLVLILLMHLVPTLQLQLPIHLALQLLRVFLANNNSQPLLLPLAPRQLDSEERNLLRLVRLSPLLSVRLNKVVIHSVPLAALSVPNQVHLLSIPLLHLVPSHSAQQLLLILLILSVALVNNSHHNNNQPLRLKVTHLLPLLVV